MQPALIKYYDKIRAFIAVLSKQCCSAEILDVWQLLQQLTITFWADDNIDKNLCVLQVKKTDFSAIEKYNFGVLSIQCPFDLVLMMLHYACALFFIVRLGTAAEAVSTALLVKTTTVAFSM